VITKRGVLIALALALGVVVAWLLLSSKERRGFGRSGTGRVAPNIGTGGPVDRASAPPVVGAYPTGQISRLERARMSEEDLLRWLEQLGHVPQDADALEWRLAQRTTWWGRPLDPKEFWKNRVVWLDGEATFAANSHGRGYPPP